MTRKKSTIEESRYDVYILVYRCEGDVNIIAVPAKHTSRIVQIRYGAFECLMNIYIYIIYISAYREAHTIHLANGIMCVPICIYVYCVAGWICYSVRIHLADIWVSRSAYTNCIRNIKYFNNIISVQCNLSCYTRASISDICIRNVQQRHIEMPHTWKMCVIYYIYICVGKPIIRRMRGIKG